ncbi:MAG: leucyl/phenylalanyl-tRNA--protein transferase [Actinomycetota bacterium]|nr:leucyl/phenylalanyl-tRNA--protein transferase [Actinomycetota bacterium]
MPIEPPPTAWQFPDPLSAASDLVAVGGDLEPGSLLAAYRRGLFPMPDPGARRGDRIAWFSPDPRGVLPLDGLHVSHSLARSRRRYRVARDQRFGDVVEACADPSRPGAWITPEIIEAYARLHRLGYAHSFETYDDRDGSGALVGGLYGVRIGRFFAGEAMFHTATDASKVALVELVGWLRGEGVVLLDVQWVTPHLESLGAVAIPRGDYLVALARAVEAT